MRLEGKKVVAGMAAVAVVVTAVFVGLTLANLDKIRTAVAIRRSERPLLRTPTGVMVIVPEGEFQVPAWEKPPQLKAFYIDQDPVSAEIYTRYLQESGRRQEPGAEPDVEGFCAWAGKRPATLEELAKARRGATLSEDTSIYGVRGLARGRGFRCALDVNEARKFR
ncbi:MAG: hypothetical protein ACP5UT_00955 [Bryobacteraceae bacterium]